MDTMTNDRIDLRGSSTFHIIDLEKPFCQRISSTLLSRMLYLVYGSFSVVLTKNPEALSAGW